MFNISVCLNNKWIFVSTMHFPLIILSPRLSISLLRTPSILIDQSQVEGESIRTPVLQSLKGWHWSTWQGFETIKVTWYMIMQTSQNVRNCSTTGFLFTTTESRREISRGAKQYPTFTAEWRRRLDWWSRYSNWGLQYSTVWQTLNVQHPRMLLARGIQRQDVKDSSCDDVYDRKQVLGRRGRGSSLIVFLLV